jgi:hypothetical protein
MYRISKDLNLSPIIGEFTTQLRVGQFDIQFSFGPVDFAVSSPIELFRNGKPFARWEEGTWPDPGFYDVMNVEVTRCDIPNDRLMVLEFKNGVVMHLVDDSDQYECMIITFKGDPSPWII